MGFADSIRNNTDKILDDVNKSIINIFSDVAEKAVNFSPNPSSGAYSIGLFANQWYASEETPSNEVGDSATANGSDSISRLADIKSSKQFFQKDGSLYFTNNTSYSAYIEDLGWKKGEGTNGWIWTGKVAPYAPVSKAMDYASGKYK